MPDNELLQPCSIVGRGPAQDHKGLTMQLGWFSNSTAEYLRLCYAHTKMSNHFQNRATMGSENNLKGDCSKGKMFLVSS